MATHSFWNDERDAIIRTIAANGGTAMEAFKACGAVSRNAVIGRSHRLGIVFGQRRNDKPVAVQPIRAPSKPRPLVSTEIFKPTTVTGKWTGDEIATMRAMADIGHSFADVAAKLGRSTQAVECKASDSQVKFSRHSPPRPPRPFSGAPRHGKAVVFGDGGKVALVDLERHHCRFIPGDPRAGGPIYCGDRREIGSSFCAVHHALCYTLSERQRVAA